MTPRQMIATLEDLRARGCIVRMTAVPVGSYLVSIHEGEERRSIESGLTLPEAVRRAVERMENAPPTQQDAQQATPPLSAGAGDRGER